MYFNCDWGEKPKAWISKTCLKDGFEIGSVKWRKQPITVKIISNLKMAKTTIKDVYPLDIYALLKSNLQKQIRRCKIGAITTTVKLWELNKFELLRRLSVIVPEDVIISKETSLIVWLMIACSKGIVLTNDHLCWILGYVKCLVEYNGLTDDILHLQIRSNEASSKGLLDNLEPLTVINSDHTDKDYLTGILFRCAYGGLLCDPPMISRCIDWYLQNNIELMEFNVERWIEPLPKLLFNPASIDFHITSTVK